jgi:hypothetical protein
VNSSTSSFRTIRVGIKNPAIRDTLFKTEENSEALEIPENLADEVAVALERHPNLPWDEAIRKLVRR